MSLQRIAVATAITASAIFPVRAVETAVAFNDSAIIVGGGGWAVYGWQFSTTSAIQISTVGLYDYFRGDGFVAQHPIGIWDLSNPSQTLLATLIPSGTVAPSAQNFRYVNVDPLILPAGHNYVIAALYKSDDDTVGALNAPNWSLTVGPGLQFAGRRAGGLSSSVLVFPQSFYPGQEESFGPNFTYTVIPEPSMLSLCLLAATAFAGCRYRQVFIKRSVRRIDTTSGRR